MDNINIQQAGPSDIVSIKKLETVCGLSTWSIGDYLEEISSNNEFFLVVKKDQELLGFMLARPIMINPLSATDQHKIINKINEVEIYNIAVTEKYRREKIASRLIERLIEKANIYNVKKIYLEVRESNVNAQKFYIDRLFKIVGKRKNFYTDPSENAILMCRELS